jgi:hypothetical protein
MAHCKFLFLVFDATTSKDTIELQYALAEISAPGVPFADFVVKYVIAFDEKLVLFLEINTPPWAC